MHACVEVCAVRTNSTSSPTQFEVSLSSVGRVAQQHMRPSADTGGLAGVGSCEGVGEGEGALAGVGEGQLPSGGLESRAPKVSLKLGAEATGMATPGRGRSPMGVGAPLMR